MTRNTFVRVAAAVGAGAAVTLSFPAASLWWLGPVGVALLVFAVGGRTLSGAAGLGYVAGLVCYLPLLSWIDWSVGTLPWVAASAGCAVFWAVIGVGIRLVAPLPGWPLWVAAVWVAVEAVQSRVPFGGFPWGRLAFGQAEGPALGWAAVAGAPGVTFVVALAGGLLAALVAGVAHAPRVVWRHGAVAAAGVAVVLGGLLLPGAAVAQPTGPGPAPRTATIAVVQGNVPRLGLGFNDRAYEVTANHRDETRRLAADVAAGRLPQPDLVVWPENSVDVDPLTHRRSAAMLDAAAAAIGVPIVAGAILDGPGDGRRNAAVVWDPQDGPGATYVKRRPAPFAEYLPLRPLVEALSDKAALVRRDMVGGVEPGLLDVGTTRLGVAICYELAFDGIVRDVVSGGAELLVLQNNSATFGPTPQNRQQLAQARMRAVEHGRATLVATTTGVSAVVLPDGRVAASTEFFTADSLVAEVPLATGRTPATWLGAGPELLVAAAGALALVVGASVLRRSRRGPDVPRC